MLDDPSVGSSATINIRPSRDQDCDAIRFARPSLGQPLRDPPTRPTAETHEEVSAAPLPSVIAGHQIVSELGRGGMGVVYLARHPELGRSVAIKMILSAGFAGVEDLVR